MGHFPLPCVCLTQSLYIFVLYMRALRSGYQLFPVDGALLQVIEQKEGYHIHHIKD